MYRLTRQMGIMIPASHFEQESSSLDCQGVRLETLTAEEKRRIPALNPLHVFEPDTYTTLAQWWTCAQNEPLYITGPAGSGKTTTAEQFCARLHLPVVTVMGHARLDRRDLIGHWSLVNGNTVWVDGPFTYAWRHGCAVIVNEFSACSPDLWVSCNDLLEGAAIDIEATNEHVTRHPRACVIVTDNTRGAAEIDEGYFGRSIQDRSVVDRFWHLSLLGLSEGRERDLLLAELPTELSRYFEPKLLARVANLLARAGADSRRESAERKIGFETIDITLSHRTLKRLFRLLLINATHPTVYSAEALTASIRCAYTDALDATTHDAIHALLATALGDVIAKLRQSYEKGIKAMLKDATRREAEDAWRRAHGLFDYEERRLNEIEGGER